MRCGERPRIATDRRRSRWIVDLIPNYIIVCQSAKKWAGICCMTLNSIVLGPAACANLLPCQILLLPCVELQVQQPSRTSGVYSTEWAMKHSYFMTHIRSYVKCSSIASQVILIWHDNVWERFQCACGTVFVIFVLDYFLLQLSHIGPVGALRWSVVYLASYSHRSNIESAAFFFCKGH